MIRFRVEYQTGIAYLELAENTKLSFKRANNLFKMADIELSRSQSFSVPATTANNRIFELANDYRLTGEVMRRRVNAVMEYSGGSRDGYLYISEADRREYKCCFVYGEMLRLKELKEAGNISEYFLPENSVKWLDANVKSGSLNLNPYDLVDYSSNLDAAERAANNVALLPSMSLTWLMSNTLSEFGMIYSTVGNVPISGLRIVQAKPKRDSGGVKFLQRFRKNDLISTSGSRLKADLFTTATGRMQVVKVTDIPPSVEVVSENSFTEFVAVQTLKIVFPADFPTDIYMVHIVDDTCEFLGDYSFDLDIDKQTVGEPLSGRTVEITQNSGFTFIQKADFTYIRNGSQVHTAGFNGDASPFTYDLQVEVELPEEAVAGQYLYMQKNLPEVTALELCKIAAAARGAALTYDASINAMVIEELIFEGDGGQVPAWEIKEIKRWVSVGSVRRTFGEYAQRNIVQYDSDEFVGGERRLKRVYEIENVNIDEEKDIYTIPLSESVESYIRDMVLQDSKVSFPLSRGVLMQTTGTKMQSVMPSKNEVIEALCESSTAISLQVPMTLLEYTKLPERCRLLFDGQLWVWTEAQWGDDVATLSLSKI